MCFLRKKWSRKKDLSVTEKHSGWEQQSNLGDVKYSSVKFIADYLHLERSSITDL